MSNLEKLLQIAESTYSKRAEEARELAIFNFMQLVPLQAKDLFKIECVLTDAYSFSTLKLFVDNYVFFINYEHPTEDKPGVFSLQNPVTHAGWNSMMPFFKLVDTLFYIAKKIEELKGTVDGAPEDYRKEAVGMIQFVEPTSPLVN